MNLIELMRQRAAESNDKLTELRKEIDTPFLHRYPLGCCEVISIHLGLALQTEFPSSPIQIVRAYNRDKDEWHYWVELENIVLDLTAHQFDQYEASLVCKTPSPLEEQFPDVERTNPCIAEKNSTFSICHQLLDLLR